MEKTEQPAQTVDNELNLPVQEILARHKQQEILATLFRYIDEYHWRYGITRACINRLFDTDYSIADLKKMYRENK